MTDDDSTPACGLSEDGVEGWDCTAVGLLVPNQYCSHPFSACDVGVKGPVAGGVSESEVQFSDLFHIYLPILFRIPLLLGLHS